MTAPPIVADPESGERGRLPRWLRPFLISLCCLAVGAVVFVLTLAVRIDDEPTASSSDAFLLFVMVDVIVGLIACVAVGPIGGNRAANFGIAAIGMVSTLAFAAWLVAVMRLGARRSLPLDISVVAVVVVGGCLYDWLEAGVTGRAPIEAPFFFIFVVALFTVIALLFGRSRGTRAALITSLRAQAASAERERAALARSRASDLERARAEERTAIARDMHDSISHDLAIVATQAGALAYRSDLPPEHVREAAATVRESAARANTRLREVLHGMRAPIEGERSDAPLPGREALHTLLAHGAAPGPAPQVSWADVGPGDLERLSDERIRALHRTLAELLVNAAKHAPSAAVLLALRGDETGLVVKVTNRLHSSESPAIGTGYGLIGARERVQLVGGTLDAGPDDEGNFVAEVHLPW